MSSWKPLGRYWKTGVSERQFAASTLLWRTFESGKGDHGEALHVFSAEINSVSGISGADDCGHNLEALSVFLQHSVCSPVEDCEVDDGEGGMAKCGASLAKKSSGSSQTVQSADDSKSSETEFVGHVQQEEKCRLGCIAWNACMGLANVLDWMCDRSSAES